MDLDIAEDGVTDVPVPESPTTAAQSLKASENVESRAPPISPPLSSLTPSRESILTTTQPPESTDLPLKPGKRLPATPSSHASGDRRPSTSGRLRISRGKSPETLSSLSSFDESEASHAERRFLRLYEELESHCSEPFPDFITPWFIRRINYGPCKTGDVVDLLRFLCPDGIWTTPFESMTLLDPYLSASLEKAVYPNVDSLNASQLALLHMLHHFIFSAYNYAQGIFFPYTGEWDEDRRDTPVDALNLYVEDIISLIEFIQKDGRNTSLRDFIVDRTEKLRIMDRKRTFLFAEGGDTRSETEEYVFQMFLALLGLWTVGSQASDASGLGKLQSPVTRTRFDYTKILPYRPVVMTDISSIRETFGVLVNPLDNKTVDRMEWIRPLQDLDASTITQGRFRFALTRDISRHMALDASHQVIYLFCEEAVAMEDSLSRLERNTIAMILNLDSLDRERNLLYTLLFSGDESRQIAFSLGLVPPRKANIFLRLSAFPNYAPHLLSLRQAIKDWKPRKFKELISQGQDQSTWYLYGIIAILLMLMFLFLLALTGTIGVWLIFRHVN